jgi:hypothetical protein
MEPFGVGGAIQSVKQVLLLNELKSVWNPISREGYIVPMDVCPDLNRWWG